MYKKHIAAKILSRTLGRLTDWIFRYNLKDAIDLTYATMDTRVIISPEKTIYLSANKRPYTPLELDLVTKKLFYFAKLNLLEGVDAVVSSLITTKEDPAQKNSFSTQGLYIPKNKLIIIFGYKTSEIITHEIGHAVFSYTLTDYQREEYVKNSTSFYDFKTHEEGQSVDPSEDFAQKFELYFNHPKLFSKDESITGRFERQSEIDNMILKDLLHYIDDSRHYDALPQASYFTNLMDVLLARPVTP